jgi:hypothetical protein
MIPAPVSAAPSGARPIQHIGRSAGLVVSHFVTVALEACVLSPGAVDVVVVGGAVDTGRFCTPPETVGSELPNDAEDPKIGAPKVTGG